MTKDKLRTKLYKHENANTKAICTKADSAKADYAMANIIAIWETIKEEL